MQKIMAHIKEIRQAPETTNLCVSLSPDAIACLYRVLSPLDQPSEDDPVQDELLDFFSNEIF